MTRKTKILKNCVIAYTDDIPVAKRDKIKGWVEHAGGSISKDITDDVTHLILTRRDWNNYKPKVKEARSRKTIYLMRIVWLEESLSELNKCKSKPFDECNKKYTCELKHAEKVMGHRHIKRAEKKKETCRAKQLAAREEQELSEEHFGRDNQTDQKPSAEGNPHDAGEDPHNGDESSSDSASVSPNIGALGKRRDPSGIRKKRSRDKTAVTGKVQQIFECGIKFDRSVIETERNMVLAGYRPYSDAGGLIHMVMLVRNDIHQILQEQYTLKQFINLADLYHEHTMPVKLDDTVGKDIVGRIQRSGRAQRKGDFHAGKDTQLRYFEDPISCRKSISHRDTIGSIDKLNDGHHTPIPSHDTQVDNRSMIRKWVNNLTRQHSSGTGPHRIEQQIPFSSLPVVAYTPFFTLHPQIRAPLPRPFAYSLQLYESIDQQPPDDYSITPTTTTSEPPWSTTTSDSLISFTQCLPEIVSYNDPATKSDLVQPQVPLHPLTLPPSDSAVLPPKKTYKLVCQYTKKGTSRASATETLAPEGSTFPFAMDIFRKIFRKKTGRSWDEAKGKSGGRGIILSGERDSETDGSDEPKDTTTRGSIGIDSSKKSLRHDFDSASAPTSDTTQSGDLVHTTIPPSIYAAGSTNLTESTAPSLSPLLTNGNLTDPNIPAPTSSPTGAEHTGPLSRLTATKPTESNDTTWTLSTAKDVGRVGYRPFTYVPTDRTTFGAGNEKYKALYGEELFVVPGMERKGGKGGNGDEKRETRKSGGAKELGW